MHAAHCEIHQTELVMATNLPYSQMKLHNAHLAYCTNIHPAESWEETFHVLKTHTLAVRDKVSSTDAKSSGFAIGLRLSARAARELLIKNTAGQREKLYAFKDWLTEENCYIFTINGFPYGNFHGTRVKEKVYQPDWSTDARLEYTSDLFTILARLLPDGVEGSVSTLPGSFKEFEANEHYIFSNLYSHAEFIEETSQEHGKDLHLGLEPEPLGHFENTKETIAFFDRFHQWAKELALDTDCIKRRIGVNYDTCHFALEYEDCHQSLDALRAAGIRISKIHLSSALSFDPNSTDALAAIRAFDEPTYLHQVLLKNTDNSITRFKDLPEFFSALEAQKCHLDAQTEARCHFHIPLYAEPDHPLRSTQDHAADALDYLKMHPKFCNHFEIETYTWGVLPKALQLPIDDQIAKEYEWVIEKHRSE